MSVETHARISDLPGWPCPPRVRDVAGSENSWGWVSLNVKQVVYDEAGYLWADGNATPGPGPYGAGGAPALLAWTDQGLAVYIDPKYYSSVVTCSRLDLQDGEPDRWIPIRQALSKIPGHVKNFSG